MVQAASGQGTKNLFSRWDIYGLKLFLALIEKGFQRKKAADKVKAIIGILNYVDEPGEEETKNPFEDPGAFPFIALSASNEKYIEMVPRYSDTGKIILDCTHQTNLEDIVLINLEKIRKDVDTAIAE